MVPFVSLLLLISAPASSVPVAPFDVEAHLNREYAECITRLDQPVTINSLQHFDFTGDGQAEVIVTASSCHTGTAGPNLHTVFEVISSTEARELPIAKIRDPTSGERLLASLEGNRNHFLYVSEEGYLVQEYHDESVRPEGQSPLIVYLKWNGQAFEIERIERDSAGRCPRDCPGLRRD